MTRHLDDLFDGYPHRLSIDQVAEVLGVTRGTAYKWLNKGAIPAYKFAGTWVVLRDELKQALADGANLRRTP